MKNLTFILGGARSGKSSYAEKLASAYGERVVYAATAVVLDEEMRERVKMHRSRRPGAWATVEAPHGVAEKLRPVLAGGERDCVLLDCLAVLSSNVLLGEPEGLSESAYYSALKEQELDPLLALIRDFPAVDFIVVSNEVGMGVVPAYDLGRRYRDLLGRANQLMAAEADHFYFMIAGVPLNVKENRVADF